MYVNTKLITNKNKSFATQHCQTDCFKFCKYNVLNASQDRKRAGDLMLMLCLNEAIGQLVMAYNVHWYSDMLRRALEFEFEG